MNGKPTVRPWVKMPLDLIESDAWRSLGINDRRLIDFLMVEHMRHGGKENGELKAPRRQLVSSGIGEHFVSAAIRNAERLGLVDAHRHGKRVATTYALTWLPFHDGTPASNRWRDYRAPEPTIKRLKRRLVLVSEKIPDGLNLAAKQQSDANEKLAAKQHSDVPAKQHADGLNLAAKQQSDANEKLAAKQHSLSRTRSYHLGAIDKTEVERSAVSAPLPIPNPGKPYQPTELCPCYVANAIGFRICGRSIDLGKDSCVEHAARERCGEIQDAAEAAMIGGPMLGAPGAPSPRARLVEDLAAGQG
ncbi:MAG TPA: hypothetical protein VHT21_17680 [Stellaceae bacterium]|jgi:hypothetical protein|nr:hypothetical protein [Stellaceae bacterium]